MKGRGMLMSYVWGRVEEAWDREDFAAAQSFAKYHEFLDSLSNEEYSEILPVLTIKKVVANDRV